jgi:APA family basic amino acid/polyamine antiporter
LANYRGVRTGAILSNITTLAKLSPLALLILFGVARFAHEPEMIHTTEIVSPGLSNGMRALLLLVFAIGGWEGALIPAGEIREPRRTIPFGLTAGLIACAAIYMLLQFITVATIATTTTDRPLTDTASVLLGHGGTAFVSIAIMISPYGWISALLYDPRLLYSLAAQGDLPSLFARLHSRFHTSQFPSSPMRFWRGCWHQAARFFGIVSLASGFMTIYYARACACLIPLRRRRSDADALRVPMGSFLSVLGLAICLALMTGLERDEVFLMCIIAMIADLNWLWAKRRRARVETRLKRQQFCNP